MIRIHFISVNNGGVPNMLRKYTMSYEKGNSTDLILNSKHHKLIGDRMSFNTCWMLHRTLNYPEQHYIWVRSIDSFDIHNDDVFECVFFNFSGLLSGYIYGQSYNSILAFIFGGIDFITDCGQNWGERFYIGQSRTTKCKWVFAWKYFFFSLKCSRWMFLTFQQVAILWKKITIF